MRKGILLTFFCFTCLSAFSYNDNSRWFINDAGGITWSIDADVPHNDHIEMSGEQISVVLRYGVDQEGAFVLERSFVWPMLRTIPNNTHASLMRRLGWDVVADMILVNARKINQEKTNNVTLNGTMIVKAN